MISHVRIEIIIINSENVDELYMVICWEIMFLLISTNSKDLSLTFSKLKGCSMKDIDFIIKYINEKCAYRE